METWAYLRASSKAQDFATQRAAIEKAAGGSIGRWLEEKRSGKTLARPVLDELRAAVRSGAVRKLYVYRLDRLTRSGIRDTFEVVDELRRCGVQLVSVNEGWLDLSGPFADIIIAVLAWAAQQERAAINERIADARVRVEAEGGAWGRPAGSLKGGGRRDPALYQRIREMRAAGRSVREVAIALKVPRSTVDRVSRNGEAKPEGPTPSGKPPPVR